MIGVIDPQFLRVIPAEHVELIGEDELNLMYFEIVQQYAKYLMHEQGVWE